MFNSLQVHGLWPARLLCLWNFPGEYWRGLPFPIPDDLSTPGTKPRSPASPVTFSNRNKLNFTGLSLLESRPGNLLNLDSRPAKWKKSHERTSFTHTQYKELEALFSCNMFPDKNLQRELALKLNLPESTVKIWFRNRRFKMKKQQQQQQEQQSPKPPSQVLPAKDVPTASTSPHSFLLAASDSYNSLSPQSLDPFPWTGDSMIMEIPTSDVQMQDPQLERLVASVPALYSDAFDITQIMELYSFPDEDDITNSSFYSLYQYLSPTRPSVGLFPGQTCFSVTSWSFAVYSAQDSLEFQNPSIMVHFGFL
ncbi:hypothetical protein FD754_005549 [Muntiacus muntjak]|uniref:Homeobox domain-containing protein n=1 Tax=Muntiacus muntjak TaxID=9888 RepID=A0A5N3WIV2_MUNMU|nr:hypothetical protein FD754_005549 [Muntiacus muntjak]